MNDVWHGDVGSIAKWGTNTFMEVALGWAVDKGLGKVGKITTLGEGVSLAKFSEGTPSVSDQIPLKDRFAFAGISPLKNERPTIKDLFVTVSRTNSNGVNNNTTKHFEVTKIEGKNPMNLEGQV